MLITGAARGLGYEVARQLANAGARVVVSARRQQSASDTATKLSSAGAVSALQADLDVSDPEAGIAAAAAIGAEPGRLDILINNAAAYVDWSETASSADLKLAEQVIATNLFGAWRSPRPSSRSCEKANIRGSSTSRAAQARTQTRSSD